MIVALPARDARFEVFVVGQDATTGCDWMRLAGVLRDMLYGSLADAFHPRIYVEHPQQCLGLALMQSSVTVDRQKLRAYLAAASLPADGLNKPLQRVVRCEAARLSARSSSCCSAPHGEADAARRRRRTDRTDDLPPYVAIQFGFEPLTHS